MMIVRAEMGKMHDKSWSSAITNHAHDMSNGMTIATTTKIELEALLAGEPEVIMQLLHATLGTRANTNKQSFISTETLITIIRKAPPLAQKSITQTISSQLQNQQSIHPANQATLVFCERFFTKYIQTLPLHAHIKSAINELEKNVAITMLMQTQWPWHFDSGLHNILMLIHQQCIGWHPDLGKAATRFLTSLSSLLQKLAIASNDNTFKKSTKDIEHFFVAQTQRIAKLEKRLHDTEHGILQTNYSLKISARALNQLMAGQKLPKTISDFLQGPMRKSMQLVLINDGENSEQYLQCINISKSLISSFQPLSQEESNQQRIYQLITQIGDQLQSALISLHHDSSLLHSQIALIEKEHLKVLKASPLEYADFDLINNSDPLESGQTLISNSLLNRVNELTEGQWFCYQHHDRPPIKLSLKLDKTKQLLFTSFFGVKSEYCNFEEFAYKLSSKIVAPITQQDTFMGVGEVLVSSMFNDFQNTKQQQAAVYAEKQIKLKQKILAQETAHLEALANAKQQAQLLQDSRLQAEAQAKDAETTRRESAIIDGQQGKIITDVNRLNVGGLVEFYNIMGECQQLKLAVKLQTTGKYLFIDRAGIKREEKLKDELSDMLLQGSAKIINEGTFFESALEKVVNSLREGRNNNVEPNK